MKILHVIHRFLPEGIVGGTTSYLFALYREQAQDNEVRIFCGGAPRRAGPEMENLVYDGFRMTKVFPIRQDWRWSAGNEQVNRLFTECLRAYAPDVVHFHSLVLLSNDLPRLARSLGVPTVCTLHDAWFFCLRIFPTCTGKRGDCSACLLADREMSGAGLRATAGRLKARWYARCLRPGQMRTVFRSLDVVLSPSRWMCEDYVRHGFPGGRIRVSPYGVVSLDTVRRTHRGASRMRFGYLGGTHPLKGLGVLLDAFENLGSNTELHLYGVNPKDLASGLVNVFAHGNVSGRDKMRALEELDVVVVPSTFPDNSPLVIHEALSAGIPVVASRIGGIPELVAGEVNGILCAPGDREGLRTALLRFVHDPLLRERLAAGAKICRHISDQAAEIRAVYDSLCT